MEGIINCFAFNKEVDLTYHYYLTDLTARWDRCQRRILSQQQPIASENHIIIHTLKHRLDERIALTDNPDLIKQLKDTVKSARSANHPVNIENELQKLQPLQPNQEAVDLLWNKAGIVLYQSNRLLFEYQPYVERKIAKIERIWQNEHKIAVNTILRTLVYLSYLDCGIINPLLYAKRWRVNHKNINLSGEIWDSIYPVFSHRKDDDILTYLNGLINGIIFINVPTDGCASNSIHRELEQLTNIKEIFYNLDYIRELHNELLDYDYSRYKQRGRPRMELVELSNKHHFDLTLNVVMIGLWLLLHDYGYVPYRHNHVDDVYQSIRYQPSIMIDWSTYRGEVYHIANVFFSAKSPNDNIHNGSNFTNLFGLGYGEFLDKMLDDNVQHPAIDKLVIWYTLYVLYKLKSIR